jgi:hypothetical protein
MINAQHPRNPQIKKSEEWFRPSETAWAGMAVIARVVKSSMFFISADMISPLS